MRNLKNFIFGIILIFAVAISSIFVLKMVYPAKYTDYINKYSAAYETDSYLIMSIIKAESNFKNNAVSSKNAKGLMQITENTALWIAEKIDIGDFDYERDILNPETNINMGCFYIDYLLEMYDGRIDCALAAYNAGFNNVDEWLLDEKYSNDGKNLDSIPFPETERYVSKVKNNYKIYKLLYE